MLVLYQKLHIYRDDRDGPIFLLKFRVRSPPQSGGARTAPGSHIDGHLKLNRSKY